MQGWEPTARHVHDDAGRLVASVPEPEWDETQRAWLLALSAYEADTCQGCRGQLSETTGQDDEGRPVRYQVDDPHRCRQCTALAVAQREAQKAERPDEPASALLYSAHRLT